MWRIRLHLSSSTLSTRPLLPKPTGSPSAPKLMDTQTPTRVSAPPAPDQTYLSSFGPAHLRTSAAVRTSLAEAGVSLFRALAKQNLHYR